MTNPSVFFKSFKHAHRISSKSFRAYSVQRKRFFKNVSITSSDDAIYEINLDQRKLKTPLGIVFQVPNEALAVAVATEWDGQKDILAPQNMHLTSLCNTALDNPHHKSKGDLIYNNLIYLESDTLCYRTEDPEDLAELQTQRWDPVVQWYEKRYNVSLNQTKNLVTSVIPCGTKEVITKQLSSYGEWTLVGLTFLTENLKSLILSQAMVDGFLRTEDAVSLSRLEVQYQIDKWGNVEWAHDADLLQLQSRISAAVLFTLLTLQGTSVRVKKLQS